MDNIYDLQQFRDAVLEIIRAETPDFFKMAELQALVDAEEERQNATKV